MQGRNKRAIPYSDAELSWIENNQVGISRKELATKFNAKFKRELSGDNLGALCKRKKWANGLDTVLKKVKSRGIKAPKG